MKRVTRSIPVHLPPDLRRKVAKICGERRLKFSKAIEEAVRLWLGQRVAVIEVGLPSDSANGSHIEDGPEQVCRRDFPELVAYYEQHGGEAWAQMSWEERHKALKEYEEQR